MPQTIKIQSRSGKTYDMPWSLPNDPTDEEVDDFISRMEGNTGVKPVQQVKTYPGTYLHASGGKTRGLFESVLPESNRDYTPETLPSFPVRAAKEIGYEGLIRPALSAGGVALDALGTLGTPFAIQGVKSLANRFRGAGRAVPEVQPVKPVSRGVVDATGREIAPPQPVIESRAPGPWDANLSDASPINQISPVDSIIGKTQTQGNVRTLTQMGEKKFILPQDLRGAKPRFNMGNKIYHPQFQNDLDKAAYIIAQQTKSKRDADFLKFFMDSTGMSEDAARLYGQKVRARIKANTVGAPEGDIVIPDMFSGFKREAPLSKTQTANAGVVQQQLDPTQSIKPVKLVSKVRPNADGSVNLLNPSQQTIDELGARGYQPVSGEIAPDGSIQMVKSVAPDLTPPNTGVSPLNLQGKRNTSPFPEGTNGGQVPPPVEPPSGIQPVPSPNPPKKPKFGLITQVGSNLKSLTAGLDLSAPLRQGSALKFNKEFYTSLPDMFKSMASEGGYQKVLAEIEAHPRFSEAEKGGVAFSDLGKDLTKREEAIMGNIAEKIPGIGRLYRGSNRAYTGYLNKLRMDTFGSLLDDIEKAGRPIDDEVIKGVADIINNATGRASLGAAEGAAPVLNSLFFSPKFVASRFKVITDPAKYFNADPVIRKQAIKSLMALVSTQATFAGLAYARGGKENKGGYTLNSSDFGKIRSGNSRLDLNAGLSQIIVAASKLASRHSTSTITGKSSQLDSGKFGAPTSGDVIWRFLTSKEAPIMSLISELWTGEDNVGNQRGASEAVIRHITPMLAQDIYDILQDDPKNMWMALPATFGGSVQTYQKKKKSKSGGY